MTMEPADRDAIVAHLRHRTDLIRYIPEGTYDVPYWSGVVAQFERGEWADAITAIERRFEPRDSQPWVREAKLRKASGKRKAA